MNEKILLWGTGKRTRHLLENKYFLNCRVTGIIDTYKKNDFFCGLPVYLPECLDKLLPEADLLIVTNHFAEEIYKYCLESGMPMEKILFSELYTGEKNPTGLEKIGKLSPELYEEIQMRRGILAYRNEKDFLEAGCLTGKPPYETLEYKKDYFRYRTFEYVADEINMGNIPGSVAEFGVFRGEFAAMINKKFPDRTLYLFDTFEGFDDDEVKKEDEKGHCQMGFADLFKQTSEKMVIERLPYPKNCKVCRGFFPDSISEEAKSEAYAFVSLDVDFEMSTYNGLDFFYPRLSDGGAIFIHDYNSGVLRGVKEAVRSYEKNNSIQLKKIPLADHSGTLVIVK